jgi:hypothetical protein
MIRRFLNRLTFGLAALLFIAYVLKYFFLHQDVLFFLAFWGVYLVVCTYRLFPVPPVKSKEDDHVVDNP